MITTLNGWQLFNAFHAGSRAVINQKDLLNKMNVYPVPDGDTGSNLSFTLKSAVDNAKPQDSLGETLRSLADSALLGARGNSGILFAQFINGFADAVGDRPHLGMEHMVESFKKAVSSAYGAISTPVEGTILTVMRDWSKAMESEHKDHKDIVSLMTKALETARHSLARTKEMLAALKKANIIDAGAKGFVEFLGGFLESLKEAVRLGHHGEKTRARALEEAEGLSDPETDEATEGLSSREKVKEEHEAASLAEIPHRFCTECIVKGRALDIPKIRAALSAYGDSLIVAGSSKTARIHIHTNEPAAVFERLTEEGLIEQQKADDMHLQFRISQESHPQTAILVDSTCDIPDEMLLKHRISMVPLSVNFGDQEFLDRFTLDTSRFFHFMEKFEDFPKTSQPGPALFRRTYQFLLSHYENVVACHLSSKLSGTYQNSKGEAQTLEKTRLRVHDSKLISAAYGLCILRMASDIEAGLDFETVNENFKRYAEKARFFVTVPSLKNFIRGGRISRAKAGIADFFNLLPVISTDKEGASTILAKGFGEAGAVKKAVSYVKKMLAVGPIHSWAIVHGDCREKAEAMAVELEALIGKPVLFIGPISPVLGAHTGPGALNIAVLPE